MSLYIHSVAFHCATYPLFCVEVRTGVVVCTPLAVIGARTAVIF